MATVIVTERGSDHKLPTTVLDVGSVGIDSRSLRSGYRPRSARRPASARAANSHWGELVKNSLERDQQCACVDVMEHAQKNITQKTDIYTWRLAAARRAEEKSWHVSHRSGFGEAHKEKKYGRRKPPPGRLQFQQEANDDEKSHCLRALQIPVAIAARARQEQEESRAQEMLTSMLNQEPVL
eukprot:TRINITY_DN31855_c0_g1_i1.p1 TRINITY_DN31855_c0_g1~~TRINITY_DN31855_c0_g1_i1.p1  ORF type:complete len:182 (-),score=25.19 TRINITY_DN31855_c0_g1_i1:247-792(-)